MNEKHDTENEENSINHPVDRQEGPEDLVRALLDKTVRLERKDLGPEVQLQIALLVDLLSRSSTDFLYTHKAYFEAALELLAAKKPNVMLLQHLLSNLQVAEAKAEGGLTALIIRLCGPRPATATMAALFSIFIVFCLMLLLLVIGHTFLSHLEHIVNSIHPLVQLLSDLPLGAIITLVFSSFLGSVVSVVTRISDWNRSPYRPLQIYINVLFRPMISLAFAVFIYAILRTGMVSFLGLNLAGDNGIATLWVVGFLAGYSERFSKDIISATESKINI